MKKLRKTVYSLLSILLVMVQVFSFSTFMVSAKKGLISEESGGAFAVASEGAVIPLQTVKLSIRAFIDGRDTLMIQNNEIYWIHHDFSPPSSAYINGTEWQLLFNNPICTGFTSALKSIITSI